MSPGRFIKSEWTAPNGFVFEMQHRYEDRALILDVIKQHKPDVAIELGTAKGGFAAMLAETVAEWGGWACTVEKTPEAGVKSALKAAYPNLVTVEDDALIPFVAGPPLLVEKRPKWRLALTHPGSFLYCDNGNKRREIELFAPILGPRALLGTHDYWTEVNPEWVEPFLAGLGYVPHRHAEFAALADPVNYPASLTRFWTRA